MKTDLSLSLAGRTFSSSLAQRMLYVNGVTHVQYVHQSIYGGASSGATISALPLHCHPPDDTRCFQASVLR